MRRREAALLERLSASATLDDLSVTLRTLHNLSERLGREAGGRASRDAGA
jgi:hypothetical protein